MIQEDLDSRIFVEGHITEYEQSIMNKHLIIDLKKQISNKDIELGMLKSEIDEFKDIYTPGVLESIRALKRANKRLNALVHGNPSCGDPNEYIGASKWKTKYDNLFQDYIKLKNNL